MALPPDPDFPFRPLSGTGSLNQMTVCWDFGVSRIMTDPTSPLSELMMALGPDMDRDGVKKIPNTTKVATAAVAGTKNRLDKTRLPTLDHHGIFCASIALTTLVSTGCRFTRESSSSIFALKKPATIWLASMVFRQKEHCSRCFCAKESSRGPSSPSEYRYNHLRSHVFWFFFMAFAAFTYLLFCIFRHRLFKKTHKKCVPANKSQSVITFFAMGFLPKSALS